MPGTPVSGLPVASVVNATDLIMTVQGGVTKQAQAGLVTAGKVASTTITDIVTLTQAAYDALGTKSTTTLYVING